MTPPEITDYWLTTPIRKKMVSISRNFGFRIQIRTIKILVKLKLKSLECSFLKPFSERRGLVFCKFFVVKMGQF